ncbi:hypothetical protein IV454_30755 [Massilia antarctica]|uniref:Uncharacterized protein n=1 Tax=Massilia antarctica TaxID=2765360 RepID=A0AA48WC72_9BURK|nr:hypothetical protein [Massilia antarctica]QPI49748.1 hypothetical protein IV454_30755 [Massilia antarctica]
MPLLTLYSPSKCARPTTQPTTSPAARAAPYGSVDYHANGGDLFMVNLRTGMRNNLVR